jgi:uncharacterized repeat protein (TIGR02543 family)
MKLLLKIQTSFFAAMMGLLVLAGCSEPFSPVLETGKGTVKIRIGSGDDSRTIFPQTPQFSRYELQFTPNDGQDAKNSESVTSGSTTITLATGSWTITAIAYINVSGIDEIPDGEYEAARGSKSLTVNTGANSVSIDIQCDVEDGTGVFSYELSYPNDVSAALLKVLSLEGDLIEEVDLTTEGSSGSFALDSGYYLLRVELEKGEGKIVKVDVIHIYKNLITRAQGDEYSFDGDDFLTNTSTIIIPENVTEYSADGISFNMAAIPGGVTFPTGTSDNGSVTVASPYQMGEAQVTWKLWNTVRTWAVANGYSMNEGRKGSSGSGSERQPVTMISWYDSIVWCNALTEYWNEKTGANLETVYNSEGSPIRNTGNTSALNGVTPNVTARGFRLPTSNEWELAARWRNDDTNTVAGYSNPWFTKGDSASGATANYNNSTATGNVAVYGSSTNSGTTAVVKSKAPNDIGLYDMNGNIWECCFDMYNYSNRVTRGGAFDNNSSYMRIGFVHIRPPSETYNSHGFRIARTGYKANEINKHMVTFNTDGGSPVPAQQFIEDGEKVTKPETDPAKTGYTFDYWFNEATDEEWDFDNDTVTENITLKAKWTVIQYTVNFISNGGSAVESQMVNHGSTASRPDNPTKAGYGLVDWYSNEGLTTVYNFSTPVTGNITLYAKWGTLVTSAEDISDFGSGAIMPVVFNVSNTTQWEDAIFNINWSSSQNYVINITANFSSTGISISDYNFTQTGITVSIRGTGRTITLNDTYNRLLAVKGNQKVIIRDLTLQGNSSSRTSMVRVVGDSGILELKGTAKITGHNNIGAEPTGGGVIVDGAGIFIMRDNSSVSNNTVNRSSTSYYDARGGGVYVGSIATFIMRDNATVSSNKAINSSSDSSVWMQGGGVYMSGTFRMEGGTISDNTAATAGSQLYLGGSASAQRGTFSEDDTWMSKGNLSTSNNTIHVVNGELYEVVFFNSVTANGSLTEITTKLILNFDKDITGLSAADITLTAGSTGAVKGTLTRTGTGVYELAVSGISVEGSVGVAVSKYSYTINPANRDVTVYYVELVAVSFISVTANGSSSETTTALTLTFNQDIDGISAADITLTAGSTGITKGALTKIETGVYELEVSGITEGGSVGVTVSKTGYAISSNVKNVNVYYVVIINIAAIDGVTAPVNGGTPVIAVTENIQYSGTVSWFPAVSGTFDSGIQYTATITLTVKSGYTMQGVAANFFTVTGAASVNNNANSGVVTVVFPAFYNLGDTGPGGGIVFYYNAAGFTMTDNNQVCYYLEAAPTDMATTLAWASSEYTSTNISGTTETGIGTGRKNTALILNTDATAPAAKVCSEYSGNDTIDWFLPSREELNALYINKDYVGNTANWSYWSSSQFSNFQARYHQLGSNVNSFTDKSEKCNVRAIRAF